MDNPNNLPNDEWLDFVAVAVDNLQAAARTFDTNPDLQKRQRLTMLTYAFAALRQAVQAVKKQ